MSLHESAYAAKTDGVYNKFDVVNLLIYAGWIISNPLLSLRSFYFSGMIHLYPKHYM